MTFEKEFGVTMAIAAGIFMLATTYLFCKCELYSEQVDALRAEVAGFKIEQHIHNMEMMK